MFKSGSRYFDDVYMEIINVTDNALYMKHEQDADEERIPPFEFLKSEIMFKEDIDKFRIELMSDVRKNKIKVGGKYKLGVAFGYWISGYVFLFKDEIIFRDIIMGDPCNVIITKVTKDKLFMKFLEDIKNKDIEPFELLKSNIKFNEDEEEFRVIIPGLSKDNIEIGEGFLIFFDESIINEKSIFDPPTIKLNRRK